MVEGSPGLGDVVRRIRGIVRPPVHIVPPPPGIEVERDVEVPVRDGTILRVNVHRPPGDGPWPVLMCAHPYGKDVLPKPRRRGRRWRPLKTFRLLRQTGPITVSSLAGWEAPDPGHWVPRGYVVVNADMRGWHRSDGVATLLSQQEAEDYHDLIEWAGTRPWSTGRVGLNGVSYLAISQWGAAAERPEHLAAICPWEGFTDVYRDFARPGGVREDGFLPFWSRGLRHAGRQTDDVREQQRARPEIDDWWWARTREIEYIEVPALVCGSFSDHNLHTRGSFEGFRRIGSAHRWLYTHRDGKWATYYSPEALAFQERFFARFLKDERNGFDDLAPIRLEVRASRTEVVDVRAERDWPLPDTRWTTVHLDAGDGTLRPQAPVAAASVAFDTRRGKATFAWTFAADTELTGPMAVRLHVEARGTDDVFLFAGVRKLRGRRHVGFEGSYGFPNDLVTHGMCKASMRRTDPDRSETWMPWHPFTDPQPLPPGEIVPVDIELLPSATLFRAGETLRLDVQGRWFWPRNPLLGQFPARYEPSPRGTVVLHTGGSHDASLLLPVVPPRG